MYFFMEYVYDSWNIHTYTYIHTYDEKDINGAEFKMAQISKTTIVKYKIYRNAKNGIYNIINSSKYSVKNKKFNLTTFRRKIHRRKNGGKLIEGKDCAWN